jgi:hypothetical protein
MVITLCFWIISILLDDNIHKLIGGYDIQMIDGRMKPDILAPGLFVVSARSDGDTSTHQCSVGMMLIYTFLQHILVVPTRCR